MRKAGKPHIEVFAPSRALTEVANTNKIDSCRLRQALAHLADFGWECSLEANAKKNVKRFAGTDKERASQLEAGLCNSDNDLLLALRGGYGAMRLLPLLNWEKLKEKASVPLAGFSDITALNLALFAKLKTPSWQTPCAAGFSKSSSVRDRYFMDAMRSENFHLSFKASAVDPKSVKSFDVRGLIWGGNLSTIVSLIGTPFFPKIKKGILYLEDVAEPAYRVERMLLHLLEAGILKNQEALLIGDFTGAEKNEGVGRGRFTLKDVLTFIQNRVDIPIVTGLPFGHIVDSASLPFGVKARVTFEKHSCEITANVKAILPRHRPEVRL